MILVVDPNVIISAVLNIGNSLNVFFINKIIKNFDFVAPEFILIELGNHTEKLAKKTLFSEEKVRQIIEFIMEEIELIPDSRFNDKIEEAKIILNGHDKDIPYLALALKLNCDILSGDKVLKGLCQNKVKNPREILDSFYK